MKRLLSGIKPSGELTLGNYIGAIKQFVLMQEDYESYVFIANLHSITVPQDKDNLPNKTRDLVALYLACGLDHNKTTIFLQSENLYHANLSWVLECNTHLGELNRMTQFKDKAGKENKDSLSCGLYTYPVLMASDILLYDADVVPVGEDQKQHVEIARDIALRFNNRYDKTFKIPEPVIPEDGARIKDLQEPNKKMSKSTSNKGCILLLDKEDDIRKKIMSAVTDSDTIVKYDVDKKPGISNLMTIYSSLTNKTFKDIEEEFKDKNYGEFKKDVATTVINTLKPIQDRYKKIINSNLINEVLDKGLEKTNIIAKKKYEEIINKVGLTR